MVAPIAIASYICGAMKRQTEKPFFLMHGPLAVDHCLNDKRIIGYFYKHQPIYTHWGTRRLILYITIYRPCYDLIHSVLWSKFLSKNTLLCIPAYVYVYSFVWQVMRDQGSLYIYVYTIKASINIIWWRFAHIKSTLTI